MSTILNWTKECERRHELVVQLQKEADGLRLGRQTKRQLRKAINGRGHFFAALNKARAEAARGEGKS